MAILLCSGFPIGGYMKEAITISAINLKGGSAKTSTILNLAGILHESGRTPVLIDCDPQESATRWAIQGGNKFPFPVVPVKIGKNVKAFKEKLEMVSKEHGANAILFDTPPQLQEEAMLTALLADVVLIPISPSPLDLWAGEQAINTVREAREVRKDGLPYIILVPSRLMPKTLLAREIKGSLEQFKEAISPPITMRVVMVEACISGLPVNLYAPGSQSHKEFKDLMKFIFTKIKK
jgi:chromosome partitioning protein